MKVAKLEALEALEDGVEVDAIKKALVKAEVAHEKPVSEQIADCKSFMNRAEKRLVKLDAERESEHALLEEGRAQLARLEANVAASVPLPASVPVAAMEAELVRLRAELAVSPIPQSSPGGFCPQHSGRGSIVDAMQAARHGGRDCPRFRRDVSRLAHVIAESNSVASVDTTTLVSGDITW